MLICGLKLTHDGAIALIKDNELIFNIELEKIANNPRYTGIEDTAVIARILEEQGYGLDQIDQFVVDGWGGFNQEELAVQPRLEIGEHTNFLTSNNGPEVFRMGVAQYQERAIHHNILEEWKFDGLKIGDRTFAYSSYLHVTGHVMSAYCTSPFAQRNESSYVLIWDGGMFPRMYYFNAAKGQIENLGPVFLLIGNIYTIFSQHFGPFKVKGNFAKDSLSVAGKVMAYIAKGSVREELFAYLEEIYQQDYSNAMGFANVFANNFIKKIKGKNYSDEDILHTFHVYLERVLVEKIGKKVERYGNRTRNLCFAGGCALNIKWNSAIRNSGTFKSVYVPPFPNDSGSAIGVACAAMLSRQQKAALQWNVYSGPRVGSAGPGEGWRQSPCPVKALARLLHESQEPVVFLNGNAELGPRALGNRSILAAPGSYRIKEILNQVKNREPYRPVAPICLERAAEELFVPGTPDPHMLFDHRVKEAWLERIPGVCHLDGTARLQTVNAEQNPLVAELLLEYEALSGIPLLCNTSANHNGSGFFPDVRSAAQWNKVNYIWCDQVLYEKEDKIIF